MKYFTYKLNLTLLNVLAIILVIFMVIITWIITGNMDFIEKMDLLSIILLIPWMFLHEIFHGIGFLFLGRVKTKNVIFGAELEKGIFYCMCKEKISKLNILIALLFPLLFIGIITYLLGIIYNINLLIFLSIINIAGAVGDIIMTIDILLMPNDIKYLDLDDTTSFTILSKKDLNEKYYPGIKVCDFGEYNNLIKAKNYKRLNISKGSIYFFIVVSIVIIIEILNLLIVK